jgi:hypothetical protein
VCPLGTYGDKGKAVMGVASAVFIYNMLQESNRLPPQSATTNQGNPQPHQAAREHREAAGAECWPACDPGHIPNVDHKII